MSSTPETPSNASPGDPLPRRLVDVRSRWASIGSWVGFGISAGLGLFPLAVHLWPGPTPRFIVVPDMGTGVIIAVLWPLACWYSIRPLAGRIAAGLEAMLMPIYRAVVWKPERYDKIYGRPLPRSVPPEPKKEMGDSPREN